jgi:hypothetical protein
MISSILASIDVIVFHTVEAHSGLGSTRAKYNINTLSRVENKLVLSLKSLRIGRKSNLRVHVHNYAVFNRVLGQLALQYPYVLWKSPMMCKYSKESNNHSFATVQLHTVNSTQTLYAFAIRLQQNAIVNGVCGTKYFIISSK